VPLGCALLEECERAAACVWVMHLLHMHMCKHGMSELKCVSVFGRMFPSSSIAYHMVQMHVSNWGWGRYVRQSSQQQETQPLNACWAYHSATSQIGRGKCKAEFTAGGLVHAGLTFSVPRTMK
jgi:hypothetical protein